MGFKFNPITGNLDLVNTEAALGDVVGPSSATDNAIARYDGTTGKLIQDSLATLSDTGKGTFIGLKDSSLTANRAVMTKANGDFVTGFTTDTQIGYLSNITQDVQTSLDERIYKFGDTFFGTYVHAGSSESEFIGLFGDKASKLGFQPRIDQMPPVDDYVCIGFTKNRYFHWVEDTSGDGFVRIFKSDNTADREYTLQDGNGTLAFLSDITGGSFDADLILTGNFEVLMDQSGNVLVAA